jgi:hypothetical protein
MRSTISHPSFKKPDPNSLIDLNYNHKPHERSAYIAFGRARNSLGLALILPINRKHLGWMLEQEGIRFKLEGQRDNSIN